MRTPWACLILLAGTSAFAAEEVSVRTLLPQMADLGRLARRPSPAYTTAQASSFDRKSVGGDPFANGDAGQFIRTETNAGRMERVMADLKGPGAVVRVWSANPAGVIRFYFDGETAPRLEAKMADLLTGKIAPFTGPYAYIAAMGTNLYFPLPYAKSLKVTVDNTDNDGARSLYYQVGYRTYGRDARVRTFRPRDLDDNRAEMMRTSLALTNPSEWRSGTEIATRGDATRPGSADFHTIVPGASVSGGASRSGTIRQFTVKIPFPLIQSLRPLDWGDPHQPHNVLRKVLLTIEVDGEETVRVPLGDFFGSAPGLNPYQSLPMEVRSDGTMICRFPMPVRRNFRYTLTNTSSVPVPIRAVFRLDERARPGKDAYLFHAQWGLHRGSTRPFRDMNFLEARGEGLWLGSNMHIANPVPGWWGEGDEKVYVDGEEFPSTFGTGTEDYYGYAWCSPETFQRPYHAQPRCDGPANFGHSSVNRWHIIDPIPYRRSMRFDMEMWHWAEVQASFAHTAYWYARPGGTTPRAIDAALLEPPKLEPPKPVEGALEGERLTIVERTGGQTSNQSGFWDLSSGEQLWWVDPKVGDRLVLRLNVPEAGRYEVIGNFGHARDYGIHKFRLAGRETAPIDFFGDGVTWKRISLGTFDLPKGETLLEVTSVGSRPGAEPRRMLGLDYLLLSKR